MHFAGAMLVDKLAVREGSVAFVFGELVLRVALVEVEHDPISRYLGKDGRRCDGRHLGVATNDSTVFGASTALISHQTRAITCNKHITGNC
jgi:hypothetical protein